jgi:hypothetical protein
VKTLYKRYKYFPFYITPYFKGISKDLGRLWKDFIKLPAEKLTPKLVRNYESKISFIYQEFKTNHSKYIIMNEKNEFYENQIVDTIVSLRDDFMESINKVLKNDESGKLDSDTENLGLDFNELCTNQFNLSVEMDDLYKKFRDESESATKSQLEEIKKQLDQIWNQFKSNHENITVLKEDTSMYDTVLVDKMVTTHDDFVELLEKRMNREEEEDITDDFTMDAQSTQESEISAPQEAHQNLVINPVSLSQLENNRNLDSSSSVLSTTPGTVSIQPLTKFLEKNKTLCRICLEVKGNLAGISFNHASGESVANLVEACTGLNVKLDPYLPQSICLGCLKCLEDFYRFKRKTQDSHRKIKEKFNEILKNLENSGSEKNAESDQDSSDDESVDDENLLVEVKTAQVRFIYFYSLFIKFVYQIS